MENKTFVNTLSGVEAVVSSVHFNVRALGGKVIILNNGDSWPLQLFKRFWKEA